MFKDYKPKKKKFSLGSTSPFASVEIALWIQTFILVIFICLSITFIPCFINYIYNWHY